MIRLSNNHIFKYMTASGALGFNGKGWLKQQPLRWIGLIEPTFFTSVTKSLTLQPRKGNMRWYNPFRCVKFIPGGVINAVGLTNPGIDWWRRKIGPKANSAKVPLVVSIFGEPGELAKMARMLDEFDLVGLELNVSCPNTGMSWPDAAEVVESCEAIRANSRFPLILKVSTVRNLKEIIKKTGYLVEAISINSIPWAMVFPERQSPLEKFGGGGVSGKAVQQFTWGLVRMIAGMTTTPVIGPSVWEFEDLEKIRKLGAKAISFGSIFLRYPWRPTLFVYSEQMSGK